MSASLPRRKPAALSKTGDGQGLRSPCFCAKSGVQIISGLAEAVREEGVEDSDRFCRTLFQYYGDRVKYWLTNNEQSNMIVIPSFLGIDKDKYENFGAVKYRINHHLLLTHAKAVNACHELVPGGKIGPAIEYAPCYPKTLQA